MAELSAERNTVRRGGEKFARAMEAGVKCWAGGIVALNAAGNAVPGATSTTLKVDGLARKTADNTGLGAGATTVESYPGVYRLDNSSGGDLITTAMIGTNCYMVDDHTVAATSGTNTRSVAGQVRDVDATGVWVQLGSPIFPNL